MERRGRGRWSKLEKHRADPKKTWTNWKREGAVWLALFGTADQLDKAQKVVQEVLGEAPFTEA